MKTFLTRKIKEYFSKKSRWSIALDIIFLVFIVLMIVPATRKKVGSVLIRTTLRAPLILSSKEGSALTDADYRWPFMAMNGQTSYLEESRGQLIFLNFWATWCPPCIAEMPSIEALYQEYKDKVDFILISQENPDQITAFMNKKGYTLPTYIQTYQSPEIFSSNSIPTTFLISPDGKIILKKKGAVKWDSKKIKSLIDSYLDK